MFIVGSWSDAVVVWGISTKEETNTIDGLYQKRLSINQLLTIKKSTSFCLSKFYFWWCLLDFIWHYRFGLKYEKDKVKIFWSEQMFLIILRSEESKELRPLQHPKQNSLCMCVCLCVCVCSHNIFCKCLSISLGKLRTFAQFKLATLL